LTHPQHLVKPVGLNQIITPLKPSAIFIPDSPCGTSASTVWGYQQNASGIDQPLLNCSKPGLSMTKKNIVLPQLRAQTNRIYGFRKGRITRHCDDPAEGLSGND
jgi:hypothetical protein